MIELAHVGSEISRQGPMLVLVLVLVPVPGLLLLPLLCFCLPEPARFWEDVDGER
jgi:hypothetical protein